MVATNLHINLFIKPGLNSALSYKGSIVLSVFNNKMPILEFTRDAVPDLLRRFLKLSSLYN